VISVKSAGPPRTSRPAGRCGRVAPRDRRGPGHRPAPERPDSAVTIAPGAELIGAELAPGPQRSMTNQDRRSSAWGDAPVASPLLRFAGCPTTAGVRTTFTGWMAAGASMNDARSHPSSARPRTRRDPPTLRSDPPGVGGFAGSDCRTLWSSGCYRQRRRPRQGGRVLRADRLLQHGGLAVAPTLYPDLGACRLSANSDTKNSTCPDGLGTNGACQPWRDRTTRPANATTVSRWRR
jgi:hypothetical protein